MRFYLDFRMTITGCKQIRPDPLALATYDLPTYDLPLPPRPIPQEPVTLSSVEELIPSTDDAIPIDARPPPSISSKESIASTTDISSLLSHHREVQETLTEDLASMARQLKLNTLNFSASLEKDKSMLDEADGNLQGNYDVMQKERSRLGAYSKKGGWTTCYVIMSVGAVAAAWMCRSSSAQLDFHRVRLNLVSYSYVLFDSLGESFLF